MSDLATIEQAAQVSAELANIYIVGGLTTASGLPGGVELQDQAVYLLAGLGIDAVPQESGVAGAAAGTLVAGITATRGALSGTMSQAAKEIARNPKRWALVTSTVIGAASLGAGGYMWMTEDQRIALEQIRADAALKAQALQSVPDDQRGEIAAILAKRQVQLPTKSILPWVVGGAALGVLFLLFRRK